MANKRIPQIDNALEKISTAFFEKEEAPGVKDKVVEAFKKLHTQIKEKYGDKKEIYDYFVEHAAKAAGGIYIPYLLWEYVYKFVSSDDMDEKDKIRPYIWNLLEAFFAESLFEEEEQRLMKPLIVLYFRYEKNFEIEKFMELKAKNYHKSVKQYIEKLRKFALENNRAVAVYLRKLRYVNALGDYKLFTLTLEELEEKLKEA